MQLVSTKLVREGSLLLSDSGSVYVCIAFTTLSSADRNFDIVLKYFWTTVFSSAASGAPIRDILHSKQHRNDRLHQHIAWSGNVQQLKLIA